MAGDTARVGIIGASGFTGAELLRICAQHPGLDVAFATGDSQAGTAAADLYPGLAPAYPDLVFQAQSIHRRHHRAGALQGPRSEAAQRCGAFCSRPRGAFG